MVVPIILENEAAARKLNRDAHVMQPSAPAPPIRKVDARDPWDWRGPAIDWDLVNRSAPRFEVPPEAPQTGASRYIRIAVYQNYIRCCRDNYWSFRAYLLPKLN